MPALTRQSGSGCPRGISRMARSQVSPRGVSKLATIQVAALRPKQASAQRIEAPRAASPVACHRAQRGRQAAGRLGSWKTPRERRSFDDKSAALPEPELDPVAALTDKCEKVTANGSATTLATPSSSATARVQIHDRVAAASRGSLPREVSTRRPYLYGCVVPVEADGEVGQQPCGKELPQRSVRSPMRMRARLGNMLCSGLLSAAFVSTWCASGLGAPASQPAADDASQLATARELFDHARQLMQRQLYTEACPKFQESHRLDPGGGTLLNLALCNERVGKTATAWVQYREALRWAKRDGRTDRIKFAEVQLATLEPRLSRLRIVVPAVHHQQGLRIERDGVVLGRTAWGESLAVDPGDHLIRASAPNKQSRSVRVHVGPDGDAVTVRFDALRDTPSRTVGIAGLRRDTRSSRLQRTYGFSLAAAGVAVISLGAFFGLRAIQRHNESDGMCSTGPRCGPDAIAKSRDAVRDARRATITVATGGVLSGIGGYLVLSAPRAATMKYSKGDIFLTVSRHF